MLNYRRDQNLIKFKITLKNSEKFYLSTNSKINDKKLKTKKHECFGGNEEAKMSTTNFTIKGEKES